MYHWKKHAHQASPGVLDHLTDFRLDLVAAGAGGRHDDIWWSVLIDLQDTSIDAFIDTARRYRNDLLVPVAYDAADRRRRLQQQSVAIFARARLIRQLNIPMNAFGVTSVHLGAITPADTLDFDATPTDLSEKPVSDDTVLTAVIDDGIALGHDLFRDGLITTRIAYAAVLGARAAKGGACSVGRVLDDTQIDTLMSDETYNDLLDEPAFYRRAGVIDWTAEAVSPVAQRGAHGTHVAGLAAGHPMTAAPDNRPMLCVALPTRLVKDTSGRDLLPMLYLAFHMLRREARRYRKTSGGLAPLVVNFSFGNSGGPHDGTGQFNMLFSTYFGADTPENDAPQPAWLVLPAGNLNLARLHGSLGPETSDTLDLTVLPDDATPNVVQMWLPTQDREAGQEPVAFQVTTPTGQSAAITAVPGQYAVLVDDRGEEVARLACEHKGGDTDRVLVTLLIAPTAHNLEQGPVAPHGVWKIVLRDPEGITPATMAVWIRRDETLPGGRTGGRQAFFSNADYVRFDRFGRPLAVDPPDSRSPVRRASTLSGFATGADALVVAAYSEKEAEMSEYSAAGPLTARSLPPFVDRAGPDVAAKADDSRVLPGVISAGSASGSWVRLSGTSVAAPRVVRAAATRPHEWQQPARAWGVTAAAETPFAISGSDLDDRAGAGGIEIDVWPKPDPISR